MKKLIFITGIIGLMLNINNTAIGACTTPGSFTLNSPSSSNIYGTSINLTWGTSSNAALYTIYYRVSGNTTWLTESGGTGTSATLSGLSYGTAYQIKIVATNICAGPPPEYEPITATRDSNTRTITTEPQAPSTNSATNIGTTSFTANWTSRTGATSYDLDVSTSSSFTSYVSGYNGLNTSSTSQSVTGLSSATRYYYRVRAVNSSGESSNSSSRTVYTIPETPAMDDASSITQTSFVVSWGAVTRADSYRLDVSTSSSFFTYVSGYQNLTVAGTSQTVSGLTPGTTYYFRVRAYDTSGGTTSGNPTTKNTITIPDEPVTGAASAHTQTSFTANWTAETGATSYRLDVSKIDDFSTFVSGYQNLSVTGTSQSITGLDKGTNYYYRLRAVNASGTSSNSNEIETITIPDEPTAAAATNMDQSSFTANWGAVTGATGYVLDVSESSDFSTFVAGYKDLAVAGTSQSVSGLDPGTSYFFRVNTVNSSGSSANSSTIETITIPADPTVGSVSDITSTSFTANWSGVGGSTGYRLDVSTASDFSSFVSGYENLSVSGTSASVAGLGSATLHYYRVRSENASGASGNSDTENALTIPATPESLAASDIDQVSFMANWNSVAGVTNYRIDVSTSSDFSSFVSGYNNLSVTENFKEVSGLSSGTEYFYRIKSENGSGMSEASDTQSALTIPSAPEISAASNIEETSFTANWEATTGADEYRLDVSTSSDFSVLLSGYDNLSVNGTSTSVTGLESATLYYYRIRSENTSGASGNSDTENALTIPATPVSLAASDIDQAGFMANWNSVAGVTNYLIDVSTSNDFSSFVSGYKNLSVNENFKEVTGLSSGTEYFYRIKAENGSGKSEASDTQSALTIPSAPEISAASNIEETSFTANWGASTGADEYRLDVSTASDFSGLLSGYDDLSVNGTSQEVSGLDGGHSYYFRVRAVNATGTSVQSDEMETLTLSSVPQIASATDHTTTTFTANWEAVDGVEEYLLDVSEHDDFSTMVTGYEDLSIDGSAVSHEITDLMPGINYFYRVSAQNASGNSAHSESASTITIPDQTSISGFSDHGSTKFRVSWEDMDGVETYEVYVATDPNFNEPVAGNNPLEVQNILTEAFVEGLTPNTIYYVKIRSINSSGSSAFSAIKTTATANSDGSVVKPSIDNLEFDSDNLKISWGVSGGTGGITSILLSHRKITESDFTVESLTVNESGDYEITVDEDWMDDLGMQYQLEVTDLAGRSENSGLITFNKSIAEVEVPISETFGTTINDYQIISIPYELTTTRIEDLFEGVLGSYDKAKWRLLKYKNDETGYVDYEDGLSVSNVQRGAGYWFISSKSVDLTFGGGQTPSNTIDEPFELVLNQGWNQIGNPYLENIHWSDVLASNGNPETVGSLFVYNSKQASLEEDDLLRVFGGGFVFADQAIALTIPVDINLNASGGRLNQNARNIANHAHNWELNFKLSQGTKTNQLAGIGMNSTAGVGKDRNDVLNPPHFSDYVAMYTRHDDFFYEEFTKDVVGLKDQYFWTYEIQSNTNDPVHLSWDQSHLPEGALILYDLKENRLIDMRQQDTYIFGNGNQQFNVYFTKKDIEIGDLNQLGLGYPNPMIDHMDIPFGFHLGKEISEATLTVFDQFGKKVDLQSTSTDHQGIRILRWNGSNGSRGQLPAGLYYYQIQSSTGQTHQQVSGKIIIK